MIINWQTNPSVDTRSVYYHSVQGLRQPPHRKAGAEDQAVHLLYYPTGPPKGSAAGRSHDCPRRIADRHDVERPKQTCTLTLPKPGEPVRQIVQRTQRPFEAQTFNGGCDQEENKACS